jgi:CBS domain containing-hemolysin-like protein
VIGDISGIVSGVIGTVIIINVSLLAEINEVHLSILMAGVISAATVGGKALGKVLAINKPTDVVLFVARILTAMDRIYFWRKTNR